MSYGALVKQVNGPEKITSILRLLSRARTPHICNCPRLRPCVSLIGSLVDASGHILVPGIYEHVAPVTEEEKRVYEDTDLDMEEYRNSSQVKRFLFDTKVGHSSMGNLKEEC